MEDASETVYSYILCSLCPVKETKPVLSYRVPENLFRNREVDWLLLFVAVMMVLLAANHWEIAQSHPIAG